MPRFPGSLMSSAKCIVFLARGMGRPEEQDTMDASIGCASTARIACEVSDIAMSPATGTHPCRQPELFASPKPESPAFRPESMSICPKSGECGAV